MLYLAQFLDSRNWAQEPTGFYNMESYRENIFAIKRFYSKTFFTAKHFINVFACK